jgi:hypothetical protein
LLILSKGEGPRYGGPLPVAISSVMKTSPGNIKLKSATGRNQVP